MVIVKMEEIMTLNYDTKRRNITKHMLKKHF